MATNWTAIRVEYVNGTCTMRELAEKYGIKPAGVMQRAFREGWDAERKQLSAIVIKAISESVTEDRIATLARFNAEDVAAAEQVRQKALEMMATVANPSDLRAIAGAIDTAQKVARLALGAETANTKAEVTTRELPASVDDFV
jgi:hypothetical protein